MIRRLNRIFGSRFIGDFKFKDESYQLEFVPGLKFQKTYTIQGTHLGASEYMNDKYTDTNNSVKEGVINYFTLHLLLKKIYDTCNKINTNADPIDNPIAPNLNRTKDIRDSKKTLLMTYVALYIRINMLLYICFLSSNGIPDTKGKNLINEVFEDWKKYSIKIPSLINFSSDDEFGFFYRLNYHNSSLIAPTNSNIKVGKWEFYKLKDDGFFQSAPPTTPDISLNHNQEMIFHIFKIYF